MLYDPILIRTTSAKYYNKPRIQLYARHVVTNAMHPHIVALHPKATKRSIYYALREMREKLQTDATFQQQAATVCIPLKGEDE
jgi:hypothetical protein